MTHYWKGRLVPKGPYVPLKTWHGAPVVDGEELDRSPRWNCQVRLETTSRAILYGDDTPIDVDGLTIRNLERITKADYDYMLAHADYSTQHAPHNADAAPTTAIDWNKTKPAL